VLGVVQIVVAQAGDAGGGVALAGIDAVGGAVIVLEDGLVAAVAAQGANAL